MAGNLRRIKTEQLHLKKELSARYPSKACVPFGGRGLGFGLVVFCFGVVLLWWVVFFSGCLPV